VDGPGAQRGALVCYGGWLTKWSAEFRIRKYAPAII
jgi:hypothetical protein